jgi:hypothetical protein
MSEVVGPRCDEWACTELSPAPRPDSLGKLPLVGELGTSAGLVSSEGSFRGTGEALGDARSGDGERLILGTNMD